jgi:hypothetical protein
LLTVILVACGEQGSIGSPSPGAGSMR